MISKPDETEFRDGAVVTAVRESRKIAVEGGKGVAQGLSRILSIVLALIFGLGILVSLPANAGIKGQLGVVAIAILIYVVWGHFRHRSATRRFDVPVLSILKEAGGNRRSTSGRYEFDISTVARKAVIFAVVGGVFLLLGWSGPFALVGIALVVMAVAHLACAFGDRTVLRFDGQGVAVKGLLGERRLHWTEVDDIGIRAAGLRFVFHWSSKYLAITSSRARSTGPAELLVPIDLLGLDQKRLVALVSDLISCRAAGDNTAPSWQPPHSVGAAKRDATSFEDMLPWSAAAPRCFGSRGVGEPDPFAVPRTDAPPDMQRPDSPFGRRAGAIWNSGRADQYQRH
jgi:hypothetical protein